MQFSIYQGEKIEVQSSGNIFLLGEIQKSKGYHIKLFRDGQLILEWAIPAILFFRSVEIIHQSLPLPILSAKHKGLFGFEVSYGENTILVKMRPLRKAYYFVYLNDEEIGEVHFSKKLTLGYRQYTLVVNVDDEIINLYVTLSFLLQLIPV